MLFHFIWILLGGLALSVRAQSGGPVDCPTCPTGNTAAGWTGGGGGQMPGWGGVGGQSVGWQGAAGGAWGPQGGYGSSPGLQVYENKGSWGGAVGPQGAYSGYGASGAPARGYSGRASGYTRGSPDPGYVDYTDNSQDPYTNKGFTGYDKGSSGFQYVGTQGSIPYTAYTGSSSGLGRSGSAAGASYTPPSGGYTRYGNSRGYSGYDRTYPGEGASASYRPGYRSLPYKPGTEVTASKRHQQAASHGRVKKENTPTHHSHTPLDNITLIISDQPSHLPRIEPLIL